jgi:hypothetical protein
MDLTFASLVAEARLTFKSPREGVRRVMALDLPLQSRWIALALTAIASTILTYLSLGLIPLEEREAFGTIAAEPIRMAILQFILLVILAFFIFWFGRVRGGTGSFPDTIVVLAWLQFLMLCVQAVQLALQVLLPPLAVLLSVASLALFFWLFTNFVAELHGFRSLAWTLAGIVFLAFMLLFIAAFVVAAIAPGGV